jgi:uncharacterized protein (DUF2384 family)
MASSPYFRDKIAAKSVGKKALVSASQPDAGEPDHRIVGYRALVSRAVEAFGDEIKASRWLSIPNRDLDGQTPLQAVQGSDYDLQVLEPILTRIEHGVDY